MIPSRLIVLFARSLGMGLAVSLISFAIAIPFTSFFLSERYFLKKKINIVRWLVVSLILIPPYVHALAWMNFLTRFTSVIRQIGLDWSVQGVSLSTWVWVMAFLPCAIGISNLALESVQPELFQAARLQRNDLSAFLNVTLPLAAPVLLAGSGFILLLSLLDYSVASLFGVPVYALEIFADYSASGSALNSLLYSLPLLIAALIWIVILVKLIRPVAQTPVLSNPVEEQMLKWPAAWSWVQGLVLFVIFIQMTVPLMSLLTLTGSWRAFYAAILGSQVEMGYSLSIALAAGLAAALLGILLSGFLQRQKPLTKWLWAAVVLPFLAPAPLVGILLVELKNLVPGLSDSGIFMPALAAVIRFFPLAVIAMAMQRRRINPAYIEAAQILQKNPLDTLWKVVLPLLVPGVVIALGLVLSLTLGELGATLMVVPPGHSTLSLKIYNYLHYGASDQVASLCLFMIFVSIVLVSACFKVYRSADKKNISRIEAGSD